MATVQVATNNTYTVEKLYQWDHGQTLEVYGLSLPSVPEVRFCHKGADRSIPRQATMDEAGVVRVAIPDSLLQHAYTIWAFIGLYEGEAFRTYYKIEIPVEAQAKPIDYTFEDADGEIYSFDQLENSVVNALAVMTDQHTEAMGTLSTAQTAYDTAKAEMEEAQGNLDAATERMDALSDKLGQLELSEAVATLTHAKSGSTHALTGLGSRTGILPFMFKATAAFAAGNALTIDGKAYTAQTPDGSALTDGFWTAGACVSGILDTAGLTVNFKGGGGDEGITLPALSNPAGAAQILNGYDSINAAGERVVGSALAQAITSTAEDVPKGLTYYDQTGALQTGAGMRYYRQTYNHRATSTKNNTYFDYTPRGSHIDLAIVWAVDASTNDNYGSGYAIIMDNEVVYDEFGAYVASNVSINGTTITPVLNSRDLTSFNDSEPILIKLLVFSHDA